MQNGDRGSTRISLKFLGLMHIVLWVGLISKDIT